MEKELRAAKRFNKAAIVIILLMLVMLSFMMVNMRQLTVKYKSLEGNYERLYEEIEAGGGKP